MQHFHLQFWRSRFWDLRLIFSTVSSVFLHPIMWFHCSTFWCLSLTYLYGHLCNVLVSLREETMWFTFVSPKPRTKSNIVEMLEMCLLNKITSECVRELMNNWHWDINGQNIYWDHIMNFSFKLTCIINSYLLCSALQLIKKYTQHALCQTDLIKRTTLLNLQNQLPY